MDYLLKWGIGREKPQYGDGKIIKTLAKWLDSLSKSSFSNNSSAWNCYSEG